VEVYWLEQTGADVPPANEWLSPGESATLGRLLIPKRRADWRLGRWTAKLAIAAHGQLPCDPASLAAIEIRPRPSGAPEALIQGRSARLSLSLSHADGVAFCALAPPGAALGCDVERVEPRSAAFCADYFTAEEQSAVARCPAQERDRVLTLLWSAKESALKALECGLRFDTRSVTAGAGQLMDCPGEAWHPLVAGGAEGLIFRGWWRESGDLVWTLLGVPPPSEPTPLAAGGKTKTRREELWASPIR
jgi:4'-phosphopantetheinyl transferase